MTIEEALFAWLSANEAVSDLVGDRIYHGKLKQNPTYPAIRYKDITAQQPMAHDGPGDFLSRRFQFDCFGQTPKQARTVAAALRRQLNGFRGLMDEVQVWGIFFLNENSDFGDAAKKDRVAVDFKINYKES